MDRRCAACQLLFLSLSAVVTVQSDASLVTPKETKKPRPSIGQFHVNQRDVVTVNYCALDTRLYKWSDKSIILLIR